MKQFLLPLVWVVLAAAFFALLAWAEGVVLWGLAVLLVLGPVWYLLTSALSSTKPDRSCPQCRKETLEPIDPKQTAGVRCAECGFADEDAPTAPLDLEREEKGR